MHHSQEELLEMEEIKSPFRDKLRAFSKRQNKVHTPPFTSPSHGTDNDVTSLFSVKKASIMSETSDNTISEMSDGVFSSASGRKSKNKQKSKREKKRFGGSIERIQDECAQTDAKLQSIREKYPSSRSREKVNNVDFFSYERQAENETRSSFDDGSTLIAFRHAEPMSVSVNIAEDNLYFVPSSCYMPFKGGGKTVERDCMDEDGLFVYTNKDISTVHLNLIRRRLEADDDRQWFTNGHLIPLPNPITLTSIRSDLRVNKEGLAYKPPSAIVDLDEVVVVRDHILEVALSTIKFTHHPLFSLEHVLAQRLVEVFEVYDDLVRSSRVQKLRNKMEALRHARKLKKADEGDMQALRDQVLSAGKLERDSVRMILAAWKAIKKLRRHQNYVCTRVRVAINKETTDVQGDAEEYEGNFKELLGDVLDEHRRRFRRRMRRYRMRLRSREEESSMDQSDSGGESHEDLAEPVYDVDEVKLERRLRARYEDSFRPPGEPKIYLFLKNDAVISEDVAETEDTRRKVVASTKFYTKFFCDGVLVCKTKPVFLSDDFVLDVNEAFSIQLNDVPEFLTVVIIEQPKGLLKKKVCELQLPLPKLSEHSGRSTPQRISFEKSEIVHYKHAGVGSGYTFRKLTDDVDVDLDMDPDKEFNTSGFLKYEFGWTADGQGATSTDRTATQFDVPKIINKWGAVNTNRLLSWIEGLKLDPQDPKNSTFFDCVSADGMNDFASNGRDFFRLGPYTDSLTFCNISEIDRNVRLLCLRLRDKNEIEFDGVPIASRAREVPLGPLRDFQRRKSAEVIEEYDHDDTASGRHKLKQIYRKVFQMCKGTENNLSYESVVDEKNLVYVEYV
ncbi:hypothetical protein GWI33_018286 [Rhynchophorus ferrugineus]|uniref:CC2D2A N-terminal C2 domain-containing protein n=1 Tax=Rhynchophorus ferrugineus TaxID=354439 RepID=A0A834HY51_RHYFE|nr:hypothetical protein GWI33_018286 [Rhynchophorus ferrugineus]